MFVNPLPIRLTGHVSHSYFSDLKRALANKSQMYQDEKFLIFGTEMHSRDLEKKKIITLTEEEEDRMAGILDALAKHKAYQKMKQGAKIEFELTPFMLGCEWLMYLDVLKLQTGADLKGTKSRSFAEFLKACRSFDYFRQANIYKMAAHLREFIFFAVQKYEPYDIFELRADDYPEFMEEGKEQLHHLVEVHNTWKKLGITSLMRVQKNCKVCGVLFDKWLAPGQSLKSSDNFCREHSLEYQNEAA